MSTRRIRSRAWLCVLAVLPALALAQQAAEPSTNVSAVTPALCCQLPDGAAITVGDVLVLPAGTEGIGEVIHAEQARGGGKPGGHDLVSACLTGRPGLQV